MANREPGENAVLPTNATAEKDVGIKYTAEGTPYIVVPPSTLKTTVPIYITPMFAGDGPASVAYLSNPLVNFALIGPPWPYTLADAENWIKMNTATPEQRQTLGVLRACHPGLEGTQIGSVDLHPTGSNDRGPLDIASAGENEYELGYLLSTEWQGNGIMRSAVREMVRYGREVLGADIIVRANAENLPSRRIIEGMKGWERVPERDGEIKWPEHKGGGGLKKVMFWKWSGHLSE